MIANQLIQIATKQPPNTSHLEARLRIQPIGLMILDFQMPRMNGLQVVEHLKGYISRQNMVNEHVELIEPRFIFTSAFLTPYFKSHLARLNIQDCFEKPIAEGLLHRLVRKMEDLPEHSNLS